MTVIWMCCSWIILIIALSAYKQIVRRCINGEQLNTNDITSIVATNSESYGLDVFFDNKKKTKYDMEQQQYKQQREALEWACDDEDDETYEKPSILLSRTKISIFRNKW